MQVRQAMVRSPAHVTRDCTVGNARHISWMHHVSYLPICDKDRIVAVLSPRDYAEGRCDDDVRVEDLGLRPAVVVDVGASLEEARQALAASGAEALAVVDRGRLVGVLPSERAAR